ncbi:MAG: hypothetical protein FWE61_00465 [Micrococcales bacterium]|nr:hypothetical protein [Micrococcales bacterium]
MTGAPGLAVALCLVVFMGAPPAVRTVGTVPSVLPGQRDAPREAANPGLLLAQPDTVPGPPTVVTDPGRVELSLDGLTWGQHLAADVFATRWWVPGDVVTATLYVRTTCSLGSAQAEARFGSPDAPGFGDGLGARTRVDAGTWTTSPSTFTLRLGQVAQLDVELSFSPGAGNDAQGASVPLVIVVTVSCDDDEPTPRPTTSTATPTSPGTAARPSGPGKTAQPTTPGPGKTSHPTAPGPGTTTPGPAGPGTAEPAPPAPTARPSTPRPTHTAQATLIPVQTPTKTAAPPHSDGAAPRLADTGATVVTVVLVIVTVLLAGTGVASLAQRRARPGGPHG